MQASPSNPAASSPPSDGLVHVDKVIKRFPGVLALDGASLEIRRGEVHARLGENGAGKSTRINMLSGVHQPDGGSIRVRGQDVRITDPRHAQALGITTIYQEHTLAPDLSPIENVFLGREVRQAGPLLDKGAMRARAHQLWEEFGGNPEDLGRPVDELGGLRQRLIEIIKALAFDAELDSSLCAGLTGVTTALHVCRGNGPGGSWHSAGGYGAISATLFPKLKFSRLLLEYDSDRAGTFAPLADVRAGTVVVLGLLTTKSDQLDDESQVASRIAEAARYKPLPELALSTQCGFASVPVANPATPAVQRAKLEMVVRLARRTWSSA